MSRDTWDVWYYGYLNRWVASITTTPQHAGGRLFFDRHEDAQRFADKHNAAIRANPVDAIPDVLYQRRLDAALAKHDTVVRSQIDHEAWLVNDHELLMSEDRGWFCDCPWWENTKTPCRHMVYVTSILRPRKALRSSINA